jgi:hypothetical protein
MSAAGWFIVFFAVVFANLPFANQRLLMVIPIGRRKNAWIRLGELLVAYFIVGLFGHLLEARAGNAFDQGWQFYAVTFSLFVVFAFPGFTARYLVKYR